MKCAKLRQISKPFHIGKIGLTISYWVYQKRVWDLVDPPPARPPPPKKKILFLFKGFFSNQLLSFLFGLL